MFSSLVQDLMKEAFAKGGSQVEYHDYFKYRISYISEKDQELMFLFVTGLTDNFDNIKKELIKCKKEFLNLFEDILQHKYDSKTFEVFDPTIDAIHRNLRPKISLVGFSGVGKTTITRLIKAEEIPMQHIPTITGDIATIKIGKLHFHLWDFAGQEQFSYLWNNFIKGSDAVLLITDSTLENVEKSKFFLELIKEQAPNAHSSVIANKQDLDDAMSPNQVEKILGLKSYSMVAKDENNRDKMITIIADILEMSAEVSPLLKPLLERDTLIELATSALQNAEFEKAAGHFEKISDLCIELGDDSLGREFYEKGKKIREMLKKVKVPAPKEEEYVEQVASTEEAIAKESKAEVKTEIEKQKVPTVEKLRPPPPRPIKATQPEEESIVDEEKATIKEPGIPPPFKAAKVEEAVKVESSAEKAPVVEEKPPLSKPKGFVKIDPEPAVMEESPDSKLISKEQAASGGLELKPEDFMVKQRPKTVIAVPKDAKAKLKTSPFAHVTNPKEIPAPKPVSPTELIKKEPKKPPSPPKIEPVAISAKSDTLKPPSASRVPARMSEIPKEKVPTPMPKTPTDLIAPKPPSPPKSSTKPLSVPSPSPEITTTSGISSSGQVDPQHKASLEQTLMDLKIKRANISKMALDFDMKELTGEITGTELEEKKKRLFEIEIKIDQQIKDLEKLLGQ